MRLKTAEWHQIERQRSAEGAEGPKWPRWARSEVWTRLSRLTRARYRHVVIHTHRDEASGTRFTSLKAASRPAGAVLGLQRGPAWGLGARFRGPSYQNTPLEWSRAAPTTPSAPELHDTTACLNISDTSN